jgi:hypothetical protein
VIKGKYNEAQSNRIAEMSMTGRTTLEVEDNLRVFLYPSDGGQRYP